MVSLSDISNLSRRPNQCKAYAKITNQMTMSSDVPQGLAKKICQGRDTSAQDVIELFYGKDINLVRQAAAAQRFLLPQWDYVTNPIFQSMLKDPKWHNEQGLPIWPTVHHSTNYDYRISMATHTWNPSWRAPWVTTQQYKEEGPIYTVGKIAKLRPRIYPLPCIRLFLLESMLC